MNTLALQQPAQLLAAGDRGGIILAGGVVLVGIAAVVGFLVLTIGALLSILGSRLGGGMKFIWVVLVFAAPFLGSLAWFVIGRRDAERRASFG